MKTVYLHIGPGKTGTSFLQSVFSYNADRYILKGLSYPDFNNDHSFAADGITTSGNALPIAAHAMSVLADCETIISPVELLNLLDADLDHLLSSEWLSGCPVAFLQDLKAVLGQKFNVQFLAVVRDPSQHIVSFYQEGLKNGRYSYPLYEYLDDLIDGNRKIYTRIINLEDSIKIVNYDFRKENIVEWFDEIMFGENFSIKPPFSSVNPSPDAYQTTMLQIANGLQFSDIHVSRHYIMQNAGKGRPAYAFPNHINDRIFTELEPEIREIKKLLPANEHIRRRFQKEDVALNDCFDDSDINFLRKLIKNKILSKEKNDRDFIRKWADHYQYVNQAGLPKGFNIVAYFFHNPDLVDARVDPVQHYLIFGAKEGRRYK